MDWLKDLPDGCPSYQDWSVESVSHRVYPDRRTNRIWSESTQHAVDWQPDPRVDEQQYGSYPPAISPAVLPKYSSVGDWNEIRWWSVHCVETVQWNRCHPEKEHHWQMLTVLSAPCVCTRRDFCSRRERFSRSLLRCSIAEKAETRRSVRRVR